MTYRPSPQGALDALRDHNPALAGRIDAAPISTAIEALLIAYPNINLRMGMATPATEGWAEVIRAILERGPVGYP